MTSTPTTWTIAEPPPAEFQTTFAHLPALIQRVLWRRGVTTMSDIETFLQPKYQLLADPFLFRQMRPAVDRIIRAIIGRERLTIYGDYDADGVTATAILVEALTALGADVHWYLPERLTEGYGLNVQAIETFAHEGTKLLLTVDCGTSNVEEITRAKALGLDVIVLDHHHEPTELPPADAFINPVFAGETYPWRGFSSAGVAFTLVRALLLATDNGTQLGHPQPLGWEKWLLDLVAISTIADMMPLRGENRTLVRYGLLVLRKTRRPGVQALFAIMGSAIERADEFTIGFMLAPRLNAAGRLQHASIALDLLLTADTTRARELAAQLQGINLDRQRLTEMAVNEALDQVKAQGEQAAIIVFAPHWSPGILGLVAGRLADRLWRPVIVMAENDGQIVGSGRSIPGFDIMSVMDEGRKYFLRFGGHPGACGFTLAQAPQRQDFERWFINRVGATWQPANVVKTLTLDGQAGLTDFTPDAIDLLDALGPYGIEHPRPLFALIGTQVLEAGLVGGDGQHLRLTIRDGDVTARCIGFRQRERLSDIHSGSRLDIAVEVSWNVWQGHREMQLKIIDCKPHV